MGPVFAARREEKQDRIKPLENAENELGAQTRAEKAT